MSLVQTWHSKHEQTWCYHNHHKYPAGNLIPRRNRVRGKGNGLELCQHCKKLNQK